MVGQETIKGMTRLSDRTGISNVEAVTITVIVYKTRVVAVIVGIIAVIVAVKTVT